jgi:ATP-dependent RNA helicase DDX10/DBP4
MALLASLPIAGETEERPAKRPKKWFEDGSDDEKAGKKKRRVIEAEDEPETLEDLEALAAGLLN